MTNPATNRERAALFAYQTAMAHLQTWRHAVRDALAAADAAASGGSWQCIVCGAHWPPLDGDFVPAERGRRGPRARHIAP